MLAQDTIRQVEGVRVGITYTPGLRPGLLVLGGAKQELLDSVRAIVARDLDYSDRFEMITLPGGDSLMLSIGTASPAKGASGPFVNYPLYEALGADYAVSVTDRGDSGLAVVVHDVKGQGVRRAEPLRVTGVADRDFRMAVHRASNEVVRTAAGAPGIAATRLLFVQGGRVYRVDSDGAEVVALTPGGANAMSPSWMPSGARYVYADQRAGGQMYLQDVATGERETLPRQPRRRRGDARGSAPPLRGSFRSSKTPASTRARLPRLERESLVKNDRLALDLTKRTREAGHGADERSRDDFGAAR